MSPVSEKPIPKNEMVTNEGETVDNQISSQHVFNLFQEYKSHPFVLVEPLGNYGDHLIWKGAQKLATLAGLRYKSIPYPTFIESSFPDDTVIYIHGGGGINPRWSGSAMKAFLKTIVTHRGITILGPQTFPTDMAFIREAVLNALPDSVPGKVFLFVREMVSYNTMKMGLPNWINLGLDHDTALNLVAQDLVSDISKQNYTFYAIREDREAVKMQRDLLAVWLDPAKACSSFDQWIDIHNKAKQIVSNRLHSTIVGSILGVPTTILPNSYHKNRSVWEYSLQQRGIKWADNLLLDDRAKIINFIYPLRKVMEMKVFQDMMRAHVHKVTSV